MLGVNQLTGFGGGIGGPSFAATTGLSSNTNSPSFSVDLGPPGPKQVICAFCNNDGSGNDPWDWGTGDVGGEAFTYVVSSGSYTVGNGSGYTGGVTIRALQTNLYGVQTISIPIQNFGFTIDATRMLACVTRGFNATPIAIAASQNSGASTGAISLNTAGARLVLVGASSTGTAGNITGPGSPVTAVASGALSLGYDLSPAGGGTDAYATVSARNILAGAAFG